MKIEFKATKLQANSLLKPVPASKMVPDWYKKMPSYISEEKTSYSSNHGRMEVNMTMKKCLPVQDMITSGYIIPLWSDIAYEYKLGVGLQFNWNYKNNLIETHSKKQVENTPIEKMAVGNDLFKILNPWRIYTPPGYSSLIMSPPYHFCDIEILPAIVDTDTYHEVNFPFEFRGEIGNGIIEMNQPLALVIPFKRDEWEMGVSVENEFDEEVHKFKFGTFLGGLYRKLHHKKKVFR